jgi:hypothetical protein
MVTQTIHPSSQLQQLNWKVADPEDQTSLAVSKVQKRGLSPDVDVITAHANHYHRKLENPTT